MQETANKKASPEEERPAHERKYGYVPKKTDVEKAVLHVLFPLLAYWRRVNIKMKVGDRIINREGLIYPSFSDVVFPAEYRVEMVDNTTFLIKHARGYAPCPVCGRNIIAVLEDYEFSVKVPIKNFTPEVAYEMVISALAKEISYRMLNHIKARHNYGFKRIGTKKVLIVRHVGAEDVITEAYIARYVCPYDGYTKIVGVNGILEHLVLNHENTHISRKVTQFVERLASTTKKLLNLTKDKIPLLGAHRNTFTYTLAEGTGAKDRYRVLERVYFKPWLHMKAVKRKGRIDLVTVMNIPRPIRLVYHYPALTPVPHVIAYKSNPQYYLSFMRRVRRAMKSQGLPTERLDAIEAYVTGALAYTRITPRNAFTVDIETLESFRRKVEEKAVDLHVFLTQGMRK